MARIGLTGTAVALVVLGLAGALTSAPSQASPAWVVVLPSPDIDLSVDVVQDGRVLTYTIFFDNVGDGPADEILLQDYLPEGSTYLGDPEDLNEEGVWEREYEDLAPGAYNETVTVELPGSAGDGGRVVNRVHVEFKGYTGPWVTETYEHEFRISLPRGDAPLPLWVVAVPAIPAAAGGAAFLAYRRRRRPGFEQVFLLDVAGRLIHYWGTNSAAANDPDLMSGMIVVLSEFVRDSFRREGAGLQELQIGDSRVFLTEGDHAVLATVVNGPQVKGLPAQMRAAMNDFEGRNLPYLADWTGRLDELQDAEAVVERLVSGKYANGWAS